MYFHTREYRIGLVGTYASGKTVFLTSLINHLKEHDPSDFKLGENVTLRKFRELDPDKDWHKFEYERNRNEFANGRWPGKTKDTYQYVCSFERTDWWFPNTRLKFYDIPGERLADAVIAVKDYAGWSDFILKFFESNEPYKHHAEKFLERAKEINISERDLVLAYKGMLRNLITEYKPYVSPSTFLLNTKAEVNKTDSNADAFPCGVGTDQEFVPLPAEIRKDRPELTTKMGKHYQSYREQIVNPVIHALRDCHALIVLVDVTMLLAGGVGMYNGNRQLLVDLLDVVKPGKGLLATMMSNINGLFLWAGSQPGWIDRIAVVAPKMDHVHPLCRNEMVSLLKMMLEKPICDHDGLEPLFVNCAAVMSTEQIPQNDGKRMMKGKPKLGDGEDKIYQVSLLPQAWPGDWEPGQYSFAEVWPTFPKRQNAKPEQKNLDRILRFIFGEKE